MRLRRLAARHFNKKAWILTIAAAAALVAAVVFILVQSGQHKGTGDTQIFTMEGSNYSCSVGFEGLRVKRVIQALDLGRTTGMGGAYYTERIAAEVSDFQKNHNLPVTGEVDLKTWKALGLTESEWNVCGAYQSPAMVTDSSSREEKIEAMIARARDYMGDPYVIGASGPPGKQYGLDCSGLVMQALYAAGIALDDINPVSHAQPGHEYESRNLWTSDYFTIVDYEDRARGDLIFYADHSGIVNHIAIYLGDDRVIESWPDEVQESPMADERHYLIMGVKRVFE